MKKSLFITYALMFLVGCSSNFGTSPNNEVVKPTAPTNKNTSTSKPNTAKKSTSPKLKYSKLELPINAALSDTPTTSSSKYTQKRIYTCSELNESRAYSLMRSGHSYLDKDGDGHPCEWGKKKIKSYTTSTYKSNCHYVGGYYRKSGTYVRGHMRCR